MAWPYSSHSGASRFRHVRQVGFVIYNAGDTLGRNLPGAVRSPRWLLGLTLLRTAFVPLFIQIGAQIGLIKDGDGILHLDVELIEHGVEILLVAALLRAVLVEELVAVVAAAEGDGPLDGDGIAVHVVLVAVVSAVQDGDADLGAIAVRSGLLPDQLLEVCGTMSPAGACTEADLDGGQDGGLLYCRWRER